MAGGTHFRAACAALRAEVGGGRELGATADAHTFEMGATFLTEFGARVVRVLAGPTLHAAILAKTG